MGLLSCFAPLLGQTSSASSVYSDCTLVAQDSLDYGEKKSFASADHVVHRAVDSNSLATLRTETKARVEALRNELKKEGLQAYIVPTADAHQSEWVAPCDQRRHWLSGFTGSAGTAIVTETEAHLFVDTRYWVQAAKEIDSSVWTLEKLGQKDVKNWNDWVLGLKSGSKIGIDASLLDYQTGRKLSEDAKKNGLKLVFPEENLVDRVWHDRPPRTHKQIYTHPLKFSGKPAAEKVADLRAWLSDTYKCSSTSPNSPYYLLSALNPIAWFLNLRGGDIAFDPVFYAYVLVSRDKVRIWVQRQSLTKEVEQAIAELGGEIRDYQDAIKEVEEIVAAEEGNFLVTDATVSWAVVDRIGQNKVKLVQKSPVDAAQAIKNQVEIDGFRRAYLRDGAAWARWQAWLEEQIAKGKEVTEWDAAEELTKYRKIGENFADLAYENISATGENAALPHYQPSPTRPIPISKTTPYLNDSGANYLDGTIDTTRTMHFGRPTAEQKRAFTRVLQGHIAVDKAIFPEGSTGDQLDTLARAPLWSDGMNYGHGTGHGVGEFLSVHESQVGIAHSQAYFNSPLLPGHITSNEPGFYEEGSFGIRLESVLVVKEVKTRRQFGDRRWFGFERLTMVPIQTRMIDWALMTRADKDWIVQHNRTCAEKLMPLVKGDKRAEKWLKRQ
ncbi:hypothetical protein JCM8115_001137 [Rhodotorula mucilaginosa]|uniref:Creatinase/aminopeptidase n=1 Tax=Rhodotorula mucilaginosa TaxID=5537 RepID=A0A9P6VUR4_RHOMI|nr:hypothetical protein C6P46_000353 [Rhodotorula mucilaginosa]